MCKSTFFHESILAPSINTTDSICVLQTQPMLFSCRAALPGVVRICPCRSYRKEQAALCETCWRNNLHHWILKMPSSLISIDINCEAITKEDCPRHHDSVTPSHDPYNTEHRLFTLHWSLGALMAKIAKRSKEKISQLLPSALRLQWYRSRNSLAKSCKIYSVSSQTKYGNFTWNLIHTSVIRRDPFLRL